MLTTSIEPISDDSLDDVCRLLTDGFGPGRTFDQWKRGFVGSWCPDRPNNGFQLRVDGKLVGALGAIYSVQTVNGKPERFCNMTSWYVDPAYRRYSLALLSRLTSQAGYHITNFTALPEVAKILAVVGFQVLPGRVIAVANLPLPSVMWRRWQLHTRQPDIERILTDHRRTVARDHATCPGIHQLVVGSPRRGYCHVLYRHGVCRSLPSAVIHDISDEPLFAESFPRMAMHFLRRGLLATRVRTGALTTRDFAVAVELPEKSEMFFHSRTLGPESIRTLYSELMSFGPDED